MSRLFWHTQARTAELNGSERAWLGSLAKGPARVAWDLRGCFDSLERAVDLLGLVPGRFRNYLHDMMDKAVQADRRSIEAIGARLHDYDIAPVHAFIGAVETALAVEGFPIEVAGVRLHTRDVDLNTALVAGSDTVRLAAKIHGWSEIHCWVEAQDRDWLAAIIDDGLEQGLYRRGLWAAPAPGAEKVWREQGWDNVVELLRSDDPGPVVLSYSVTEWFPNPAIADWDPQLPDDWRPDWAHDEQGKQEWDAMAADHQDGYRHMEADAQFAELSRELQWHNSMAGLRKNRPWARLGPDTLTSAMFDLPVSVYDLLAPDRDERVARAARDATRTGTA